MTVSGFDANEAVYINFRHCFLPIDRFLHPKIASSLKKGPNPENSSHGELKLTSTPGLNRNNHSTAPLLIVAGTFIFLRSRAMSPI